MRRGERREDLCETFVSLHLRTRRRQGLPIQPRSFFERLWEEMIEPGHGFVQIAQVDEVPAAAAVFLHGGTTVTYKYGASAPEHLSRRPNHLVFWEAIRWACLNGYETLDFGRSDADNQGLRAFKSGWGTVETELAYSTLGGSSSAPFPDPDGGARVRHPPQPAVGVSRAWEAALPLRSVTAGNPGQPGLRRRRAAARASSSAIWIAFSAAPLRRLSPTTNRARPFSAVGSRADAADEHVVAAGGPARRGEVLEPDPGRRAEDRGRLLGRERLLGLEPDRLGVADEHRHAHTRRADRQLGQLEDLARLLAQLRLLVELDAVEGPVHAQVVSSCGAAPRSRSIACAPAPETDW